jgi:hypothetical protein
MTTEAKAQDAAMQDDLVERVAQLLMDMDSDGRGYEDQARAIIPMVLDYAAEALRDEAQAWENMGGSLQANRFDRVADWLQQRANAVRGPTDDQ